MSRRPGHGLSVLGCVAMHITWMIGSEYFLKKGGIDSRIFRL